MLLPDIIKHSIRLPCALQILPPPNCALPLPSPILLISSHHICLHVAVFGAVEFNRLDCCGILRGVIISWVFLRVISCFFVLLRYFEPYRRALSEPMIEYFAVSVNFEDVGGTGVFWLGLSRLAGGFSLDFSEHLYVSSRIGGFENNIFLLKLLGYYLIMAALEAREHFHKLVISLGFEAL